MSTRSAVDPASVSTRPPAKLNLFLELLARRDDGFHEIDSVMVAIDWCDELQVSRTAKPEITLDVAWLPSTEVIARRLAITTDAVRRRSLLEIPQKETNLVYRALDGFRRRFNIDGGFRCTLGKRIPAGAGMGGASSDAASALGCAAKLCGLSEYHDELRAIAESIGSDVPFFLGSHPKPGEVGRFSAARSRGRGEKIEPIDAACQLQFVVVFPAASLSTASVYSQSKVPAQPRSAQAMITALETGDHDCVADNLCNRLSPPAEKIVPRISEILDVLWRSGLRGCQLTGSGSACFGIANTRDEARRIAARLQSVLQPGALVVATRCTSVPSLVHQVVQSRA